MGRRFVAHLGYIYSEMRARPVSTTKTDNGDCDNEVSAILVANYELYINSFCLKIRSCSDLLRREKRGSTSRSACGDLKDGQHVLPGIYLFRRHKKKACRLRGRGQ
jgi:hypothetical protein